MLNNREANKTTKIYKKRGPHDVPASGYQKRLEWWNEYQNMNICITIFLNYTTK